MLVEGSAPGAPQSPGKARRLTIPAAPARFVGGHPSFEDRSQPFAVRFAGTAKDVLRHPAAFFTHLTHEGMRGVSWFAYVCLLVGHAASAGWQIVVGLPIAERVIDAARLESVAQRLPAADLQGKLLAFAAVEAELVHAWPIAWVKLLLAPLTAFFALHLLSGILHVGSRAFSTTPEDRVSYEATYRAFAYAMAPMLLGVLPIIGGFAPVWTIAVVAMAMVKLHRLRFLGVLGGVLFPAFFVWFLWGAALELGGPPLAEALGAHAPPRADVVEPRRP